MVGALPAFATVRDAVLSIEGGPLVSLTIAMNALAGLTGTASGGMAIALNELGAYYMTLAGEYGINPELMHRITTLSAGTLDALPHNGTVLILLKLCGLTHRESYFDMVMTVIVTCIVALVAVLILGTDVRLVLGSLHASVRSTRPRRQKCISHRGNSTSSSSTWSPRSR